MLDDEDGGSKAEPPADFVSALQPGPGKWASCIRVMDASLVSTGAGCSRMFLSVSGSLPCFSACACFQPPPLDKNFRLHTRPSFFYYSVE